MSHLVFSVQIFFMKHLTVGLSSWFWYYSLERVSFKPH